MDQPCILLSSGRRMPAVGFGTWQANNDELERAVEAALEAGYRHIDTAAAYENEHVIGRVLHKWITSGKIKREDLFITSKLPPAGNRASGVEKYIKKSLLELQLDYLDCYLIHTPFGFPDGDNLHPFAEDGTIMLDTETDHVSVWKAMETQVLNERTKTIGLSNFNEKQIQRVLDNCHIKPAVLQIELHLFFQQRDLTTFCKKKDIVVTAYSPLGSSGSSTLFERMNVRKTLPNLLNHPEVVKIAQHYGKTTAQVLLKHILQKGHATIPKSVNKSHIKQNIQLNDFNLSDNFMAVLDNLDQGETARIVDFSFFKGLKMHPEFPF